MITPNTGLPNQHLFSNFVVSCSSTEDTLIVQTACPIKETKIAFCGALAWGGIWAIPVLQLMVTSAQRPFISVGFVPVSLQRWASLSLGRAEQGQKESKGEQEHQNSARVYFPFSTKMAPVMANHSSRACKERSEQTPPQVKG